MDTNNNNNDKQCDCNKPKVINDLLKRISNLEFDVEDKQREIERLKNIIKKAKMYCEDVIQEHENGEYDVDTVWLAIKEHKGNIKSVLNILNGDLENYWIR